MDWTALLAVLVPALMAGIKEIVAAAEKTGADPAVVLAAIELELSTQLAAEASARAKEQADWAARPAVTATVPGAVSRPPQGG